MLTRTMWKRWGCALTRGGMRYFKGKGKLFRNRGKNHYHDSYGRGNQVSWFIYFSLLVYLHCKKVS